jgi:holo-[acyl-carrier protein] synthase
VIYGIGTDIVNIARIRAACERHGERFAARILAPVELSAWREHSDPPRLLAKRFAAKEAFGKALGTGVAVPATLHAVAVVHDPLGKPLYQFDPRLQAWMAERQLRAHLSISDEVEQVIAFAIVEQENAPAGALA